MFGKAGVVFIVVVLMKSKNSLYMSFNSEQIVMLLNGKFQLADCHDKWKPQPGLRFCVTSSEAPCQWSPVCACSRGPSGSWR